jgi:dTDP-4-dehydrorhamnose 3,5-epimerase-like enzyme
MTPSAESATPAAGAEAAPAAAVKIDVIAAHTDPRGMVFEPLEADAIARHRNMHVVITAPGAIRGNHRHIRGTEVTTVVGPVWVRYRESQGLRDVHVPTGEVWRFSFPPGVAHAFKNSGSQPFILASFNTEEHRQDAPDVVRDVLIEA